MFSRGSEWGCSSPHVPPWHLHCVREKTLTQLGAYSVLKCMNFDSGTHFKVSTLHITTSIPAGFPPLRNNETLTDVAESIFHFHPLTGSHLCQRLETPCASLKCNISWGFMLLLESSSKSHKQNPQRQITLQKQELKWLIQSYPNIFTLTPVGEFFPDPEKMFVEIWICIWTQVRFRSLVHPKTAV